MNGYSVVLTGAAGRIGRATSSELTKRGWAVVGVDRDEQGLEVLQREVPGISVVSGDISESRVLQEAGEVAELRAPLAGWVNNAVSGGPARLDELEDDVLDQGLTINLRAVIVGARVAVRSFLRSGLAGAIVNISSVHGRVSYPGCATYDACKGGLEAFTRYVCVEYGHRGIRCNALAPGAVVTPEMMEDASEAAEAARQELMAFSPMKALIPTANYARIIAFLLSEDARFINGHVLPVDGGLLSRCYPFDPDPSIPGPLRP